MWSFVVGALTFAAGVIFGAGIARSTLNGFLEFDNNKEMYE